MSDFQGQNFTHTIKSPHMTKIIKPKSGLSSTYNRTKSRNDTFHTSQIQSQRIEAKQVLQANQRRIANEDLFDQFMEKVLKIISRTY